MHSSSCEADRPGGLDITERALAYCRLPANARVLDIGCGNGITVDYLREKHGFLSTGIDLVRRKPHEHIFEASAENLPFTDQSFHAVMMECSLSLIANPITALSECRRVLTEGGRLILSDMYSLDGSVRLSGRLGRIDSREAVESILNKGGFRIALFEDHRNSLLSWWSRKIFEQGSKKFHEELGYSAGELKALKCSYYLIVADKEKAGMMRG